jgi:phenylalanine-4-hydroxylase
MRTRYKIDSFQESYFVIERPADATRRRISRFLPRSGPSETPADAVLSGDKVYT